MIDILSCARNSQRRLIILSSVRVHMVQAQSKELEGDVAVDFRSKLL